MQAALRAGLRGAGRVSPNPMVGAAALLPDGRIVASGHARFGGPHAEVRLLRKLPHPLPPGTVLFVTLEPCAHTGKTPPCTDRIIEASPARVVIAAIDPFPLVRGRGAEALRRAGIEVEIGPGEAESLAMNLPFHLYLRERRSLVAMKLASSMDARLSAPDGASRWITGLAARRQVHLERSRADAVLVGAGTVAADDPALAVRLVRGPQPSRIVVDSTLRTPPRCRLWRVWRDEILRERASGNAHRRAEEGSQGTGTAAGNYMPVQGRHAIRYRRSPRLILATVEGARGPRLAEFRRLGWEVWELTAGQVPGSGSKGARGVSLGALAKRAGREGLLRVLVEAGPRLAGSLMAGNLIDEVSLYLAPMVLGGDHVWPQRWSAPGLGRAPRYDVIGHKILGGDVWLSLRRPGLLARVAARRDAR